MSLVGAMIPGEDASHDAALLALQLKPFPKGSSPDEFSTRVTFALENHIPYLERPFADDASMGDQTGSVRTRNRGSRNVQFTGTAREWTEVRVGGRWGARRVVRGAGDCACSR